MQTKLNYKLQNTFGLGETVTGALMAVDNVLALFLLPLFGALSDKVSTPILSGFLLEKVSYRTLFPYSFVFAVLSFCTMSQVHHGDVRPEKKGSLLENFDVDD